MYLYGSLGDCVLDIFFIIAVQTPGSGISILLAVGTPFTGSENLYCQWELSPGSNKKKISRNPYCGLRKSIEGEVKELLKMFDLAYKFETENDEQTKISIIVNAIKNMTERDPAMMKTVVENQEGDVAKNVVENKRAMALVIRVRSHGGCIRFLSTSTDLGSIENVSGVALEQTYGCKLCIGPCTTRHIDKKLTQAQLAQMTNEKPQIIQEYKSGKAISYQQIITKLSHAMTHRF
nr:multiprotein-bridging factor 1b [Tanacetum cinerariifolium]